MNIICDFLKGFMVLTRINEKKSNIIYRETTSTTTIKSTITQ